MAIEEILFCIVNNDGTYRQTGRTTALKEAAEKIKATFVLANESQKKEYRSDKLKTATVYDRLMGSPLIFDHYAFSQLLLRAIERIEKLKKEKRESEVTKNLLLKVRDECIGNLTKDNLELNKKLKEVIVTINLLRKKLDEMSSLL